MKLWLRFRIYWYYLLTSRQHFWFWTLFIWRWNHQPLFFEHTDHWIVFAYAGNKAMVTVASHLTEKGWWHTEVTTAVFDKTI
jgi:hypothetical protein